ncbi:MAG: hypothetical protein C5B52_12505 [Bacteroidetes bacterium]|nr:MAG: hypothetical protein C5B52_12505 [Bacteroidota bacterium]
MFEFFQGIAIALYFTAAISIFLEHLPAKELPNVFILSALLLWVFGMLYNKLEERLLTRNLILGVILFNGIFIVLFRFFIHLETEKWFLYIFLGAFNIFYLLNNLEFWGLVAQLFDVRQSKRLFAIVSAGDVPAKLIGFALAFFLSKVINTEDLLWIASGSVVISLLIFIPLSRYPEMVKLAPSHAHHYATQTLQSIQASITSNKLIRNVAFVSFFSFCFYIVVSFVLYGYVKTAFHSNTSLASFFGIFLASSRAITLLIKLLFTNRLVDTLGLRKSLLIAPILLLVLSGIAFFLSENRSTTLAFYLFGIMAISVDILRSAIQTPVLLATLQPLSVHQRLKGHTIIKGLMDPFAFFVMGIVLIIVAASPTGMNFKLISLILLVITGLWIITVFSVDKNYIKALTTAIRKRILSGRDISLTDSGTLAFLLNKIEEGTEQEIIAVLQLVGSQNIRHDKFYQKALHHKSPVVREQVLHFIRTQNNRAVLGELKQMLLQKPDHDTLPHLVQTIALLDSSEDMSPYLEHENSEVAKAAALAILTHEDHPKKINARTYLLKLFESHDPKPAINALEVVGELRDSHFSEQVSQMMKHHNEEVKYHAQQAAGKIANEFLLNDLLQSYLLTTKDYGILEALSLAGSSVVPRIKDLLQTEKVSSSKRRKLFSLLGKIGTHDSIDLLQHYLEEFPQDADILLSTLHHLNFACNGNSEIFRKYLRFELETASYNLFRLRFLKHQSQDFATISSALELELNMARDKCIWIFSFLYDQEKIRRAKSGFELNTKESRANSFELIGMTVPKEFSVPFAILFEEGDREYKYDHARKHYKEPDISLKTIVRDILSDDVSSFNHWTKASMMYDLRNRTDMINMDVIQSCLASDNILIKETAEFIVNRSTGADYRK